MTVMLRLYDSVIIRADILWQALQVTLGGILRLFMEFINYFNILMSLTTGRQRICLRLAGELFNEGRINKARKAHCLERHA